ncbi:MAG: aldose epimerase family protein [Longimicrobiales bacterium]
MSVHTLTNGNGLEMRVASRGGIIMSLLVPDRTGRRDDVVLGFDAEEDYAENPLHFGVLIGRYANRIAFGRFSLDGVEYTLARNDGSHHLHGGRRGFDSAEWQVERSDSTGVVLSHTSPDGDEGYPGTLRARVTYTLAERDELIVEYHAVTDRATPVNLTQHSYFNLAGHDAGDVLDHVLVIAADRFTALDAGQIPTGELRQVAGTPFDFRQPTPIGARIDETDAQLQIGGGYDHNYVLNGALDGPGSSTGAQRLRRAAVLFEPVSGRAMEVWTTEPGMQLYTANERRPPVPGKDGAHYGLRCGLALETQHFPDSPNQPTFPSTILRPGAEYRSRTVYRFTTREV